MAIDWNVKNAVNRDVERQHLNKILADIRASVDALNKSASTPASDIESTVGKMVDNNTENGINVTYNAAKKVLDFVITDFTITLTGDVTGSGTVSRLGDVTISTEVDDSIGIEEAPTDGLPYWRVAGDWQYVGVALESLANMSGTGFTVIRSDDGWITREFEVVAGELVVTNADGDDGNPIFGLADLADTGIGTFKLLTRDDKGRLSGTEDGTAADVPYDNTTSGLLADDVQAALDELAASGTNVTISDTAPLSPDDGALWFDSSIGSLFLYYDDGTSQQWVEIGSSGGGGSSAWTTIKKTATETRSSTTTLANDSLLLVSLNAGVTYNIRATLIFEVANGVMDLKCAPAFSGTASSILRRLTIHTSTGTIITAVSTTFGLLTPDFAAAGQAFVAYDIVFTASTSGTFSFQWAQNTSNAGNLTLHRGSYLEYTAL